MSRISCLAGIDDEEAAMFMTVLEAAGAPLPAIVSRLTVFEIGKLGPQLLVCDIDDVDVDTLEMLRQLRFVLPACIIVVYTADVKPAWGLACHLAGANGVISKDSDEAQLVSAVRFTLRNGCFTDPRFTAA